MTSMQSLARSALSLSIAAVAGCSRGDGQQRAPDPEETAVAAPPGVSGAASPKWPKAACSIISADDVAAVLRKPVTARAQDAIAACDYLTGGADQISINYWNDKSEFEIMKALIAKRGAKSTPVSGLGAEAMYGTYGTDGGLAVRLADGRAFMVVGHDRDAELAIAKLLVPGRQRA